MKTSYVAQLNGGNIQVYTLHYDDVGSKGIELIGERRIIDLLTIDRMKGEKGKNRFTKILDTFERYDYRMLGITEEEVREILINQGVSRTTALL